MQVHEKLFEFIQKSNRINLKCFIKPWHLIQVELAQAEQLQNYIPFKIGNAQSKYMEYCLNSFIDHIIVNPKLNFKIFPDILTAHFLIKRGI